MARYGMVMDLDKCNGCQACVIACKVEHNTANEVNFTRIFEREVGTYPNANRQFLPVMCNHCEDAPCIDVCPTKATYARDKDGIVLVDWDKCIGCGACILACPYEQRFQILDNQTLFPDGQTGFEKPDTNRSPNGVAAKCDLCYHRVDEGKEPACAEACPTDARIFGVLDEEPGTESETPFQNLNDVISRKNAFSLLPEKGTKPCVYYIG
jgi:molybdopterin-containing oxidoreductase family iron-sulfur binding subunit